MRRGVRFYDLYWVLNEILFLSFYHFLQDNTSLKGEKKKMDINSSLMLKRLNLRLLEMFNVLDLQRISFVNHLASQCKVGIEGGNEVDIGVAIFHLNGRGGVHSCLSKSRIEKICNYLLGIEFDHNAPCVG